MARKRAKPRLSDRRQSISRRKFLAGVVASAAVGATLPVGERSGTFISATGGVPAEPFRVLNADGERLLTAVLNRLVPANRTMPGAGDLGLSRFIDGVMADAPHLRRSVSSLLADLPADQFLPGLSPEAGRTELRRLQRTHRAQFNDLLRATYTGYYSHPRVLDRLGWTVPESHEAFDPSCLEAVRARGPIYRDV